MFDSQHLWALSLSSAALDCLSALGTSKCPTDASSAEGDGLTAALGACISISDACGGPHLQEVATWQSARKRTHQIKHQVLARAHSLCARLLPVRNDHRPCRSTCTNSFEHSICSTIPVRLQKPLAGVPTCASEQLHTFAMQHLTRRFPCTSLKCQVTRFTRVSSSRSSRAAAACKQTFVVSHLIYSDCMHKKLCSW